MYRFYLLWICAACLFCLSLPGRAQSQVQERRVVEKSLPARAIAMVAVRVQTGNVRIIVGKDNAVQVRATRIVHAATLEAAKRAADQTQVKIETRGDRAIVEDLVPQDLSRGGRNQPWIELDVEITMPANCSVSVALETGNTSLTGKLRDVSINSATGSVRMENVQGEQITVLSSTGNVAFTGQAKRLSIVTETGSIRIPALSRVGESVTLRTETGNINADLEGVPRRGLTTQATTGSVHIALPRRARGSAELSSTNGATSSDFPLTHKPRSVGDVSDSRSGNLNGGGPSVRLTAETGNVQLIAR